MVDSLPLFQIINIKNRDFMLLNPIFSNILTHLTYTELLLKPGGWEAVVRVLTRGSYSFA